MIAPTLGLPLSTMLAFVLVLARVGGLIAFLPIPGFRNAPEVIRIVLVLAVTFALFPVWPALPDALPSFGELLVWALAEAGFGLVAGLAIAFLTEGFQVASQALGIQAGYGYAATIDPNTQADAGIIQVMTTLTTGLLFFTMGIDHTLIQTLAVSFQKFPVGTWIPAAASLDGVLRLSAGMFTLGLRVALPVIALLLLIDVALALLGRMQQQLQLLSFVFPLKMLATLALLAILAPVTARVFEGASTRTMSVLWRLVTQGGPR